MHFAHVDDGTVNPIVLARTNCSRGRAAEAIGDNEAMRAAYEAAARRTTVYDGQLARAKLGLEKLELRAPLHAGPTSSPVPSVRNRAGGRHALCGCEQDVVGSFVVDLAEQRGDVATMAALGERTGVATTRGMLEIGQAALAHRLAVDHCAFSLRSESRSTGLLDPK